MKRLSKMIQAAMEQKQMSNEDLAKKLNISESYARHLKYGSKVAVSDELVNGIAALVRVVAPKAQVVKAAAAVNKVNTAYRAELRERLAKKSTKRSSKKSA